MRVLVVQEELVTSQIISQGLSAKGFDSDIVHNGEDALWHVREGAYVAIVLDLILCKINGYDVCQSMRDEGINIPILIVTAKSGEYDEIESLELGADDFLRKPFSIDVLIARLQALLRRGNLELNQTSIGPLRYEHQCRTCWVNGQEIRLTNREAQVLQALLFSQGKVVPKQALIHSIWGMDFDGDPNIIDVYIGYLRRKIDRPHGLKLFETVRGVGYRLSR
ncbi:MAG: DNA-binding response regulator [Thiothrix sp.]|nr:MAG: DNA-binding response regulator [Thiothrix sp.]